MGISWFDWSAERNAIEICVAFFNQPKKELIYGRILRCDEKWILFYVWACESDSTQRNRRYE